MTTPPKVLPEEPSRDMVEAAYPLLTSRPVDTPDRARRLAYEVWGAMWEAAERPATLGLTRHQQSVHNFIAEYIGEHNKSPMWREIIAGSTVPTTDHLRHIIKSFERMGILSRGRMVERGIRLHVWPGEQIPNPIKNQNRGKKKK